MGGGGPLLERQTHPAAAAIASGHISEFKLCLAGVPQDQAAQTVLALQIQPHAPLRAAVLG